MVLYILRQLSYLKILNPRCALSKNLKYSLLRETGLCIQQSAEGSRVLAISLIDGFH